MKNLIHLFLIGVTCHSFSQSSTDDCAIVDSLQAIVANNSWHESPPSAADSLVIDAYWTLGDKLILNKPDSSIRLWNEALDKVGVILADSLSNNDKEVFQNFKAGLMNNLGVAYFNKGDAPLSLKYFKECLNIMISMQDSLSVGTLIGNIGFIYNYYGQKDSALAYYEKALSYTHDSIAMASTYLNMADVYSDMGKIPVGIEYYEKGLHLAESVGDLKLMSDCYGNMAYLYSDLGKLELALQYQFKALKISEQLGYKSAIASDYNKIANLYKELGYFEESLSYHNKSLQVGKEIDDKIRIANSYNNIGSLYDVQDSLELALEFFKKSNDLYIEIGNINSDGYIASLNNIGSVYERLFDLGCALDFYKQSLSKSEQINSKKSMVVAYGNVGRIYLKRKNINAAQFNVQKAYALSIELGYPKSISYAASLKKEVAKSVGNYKEAFKFYEIEMEMRDSITSQENQKTVLRQSAKYEYEKKHLADSLEHVNQLRIKQLELEKLDKERQKQRILLSVLIFGFVFISIALFFIIRLLQAKRKANILLVEQNEEINQKNEEVLAQRDEIESHKDEIEAQRDLLFTQKNDLEQVHEELSSSIDYALRIQNSVLPKQEILNKYTAENFALLLPKDKVSGDFYWWCNLEDYLVVVAADCTGHGVPGAFMSMLSISLLQEIVTKEYITHSGVILNKMRKEIIRTLGQKGKIGEQKDGLDIALISINLETKVCQFSGANNPLYLIRNNELFEHKADRMPIGIHHEMKRFCTEEIQLQSQDQLYLFSDGFIDQFGGEKGKKFKRRPFKDLLLSGSSKPMNEQKEALLRTFKNWKGKLEQLDDVLIVGVKV